MKQLSWASELRREMQKVRGVERQQLRFKSYGGLWTQLRLLALYDRHTIDLESVKELSKSLSDWYFSESGGLLLTVPARNFYFALQELLQGIQSQCLPGWKLGRSALDPRSNFSLVLEQMGATDARRILTYLENDSADALSVWITEAPAMSRQWLSDIKALARRWGELNPDAQFCALQQIGSVLRTVLVRDVESRIS